MLEALGFRFTDSDGNPVTGLCGGNIHRIAEIDASMAAKGIGEAEFIIACDVQTPFCGPEGAAAVFGPQKGGTPGTVAQLEEGMQHLNNMIIKHFGTDLSKEEGTGAAGGLGGAFKVFLNAQLHKGIDMVLDAIGFDRSIEGADLIITGEGKIDSQTARGKVIAGITERAGRYGIPVIGIAGIVDLDAEGLKDSGMTAVYPIGPHPKDESDLEYAMRPEVASKNISQTVASILQSQKIQSK
jgi:glycerate kinase